MRADGSHVRQLTQRHPRAHGPTGEHAEPQFSPDGMTLLGKLAASRARSTVNSLVSAHLRPRHRRQRVPVGAGADLRAAQPDRVQLDISLQWQLESDPGTTSEVEVRFVAESPTRTRVELEHWNLHHHGEGWQKMRDAIGATDGWDLGLRRYAERLATEPAGLPSTG